jgi:hypothetical protein
MLGSVPTFLYLFGGLFIWALRFLAGYSFVALACARGWHAGSIAGIGVVPLVVVVLTALALAACAAILVPALLSLRRAPPAAAEQAPAFIHAIAATVAALGMLAILWETLPFLLVPVCR